MPDCINRKETISALEKWLYDANDYRSPVQVLTDIPPSESKIIHCKDCKWWDKNTENYGYCQAATHGHCSAHWEISIRRTYGPDFYCADAELRKEDADA